MSVSSEVWGWEKEANLTFKERAVIFLYNPSKRSVLGRNARQWGVVLAFYAVFYLFLALLFSGCMWGLLHTISPDQPTRILTDSLIGNSPGISMRPRENLINFSPKDLETFLKPYENVTWFQKLEGCKLNDSFGRPQAPCIYVKINKIFEWVPEIYEELPTEAPDDLKIYVASLSPQEKQQVWVSCAAESGNVTISYPWGRGFHKRFFPYRNQKDYLSPLVAVQIMNTTTVTAVRCRAWAPNIRYSPSVKNPEGYARIEL